MAVDYYSYLDTGESEVESSDSPDYFGYLDTEKKEEEAAKGLSWTDDSRGFFSDFASEVWRSTGSALESTGRGIETFSGGEYGEGLRNAGEWIQGTEYAKQDYEEATGQEGAIKTFARDVVGTITESFVGTGTAAAVGGAISGGNPFVAGAAGLAQLITQFGGGTYSELMETGAAEGLSGEQLHTYAKNGALWEVIPELGDQIVTVLSAGLLGPAMKGGRKALQAALKAGTISADDIVKGIAKAEAKAGYKAVAGSAVLGGTTEVITSLGQGYEREKVGLEKHDENYARTWLLGAVSSGGPAVLGRAYVNSENKKRTTQELRVLNSDNAEVRTIAAENIYSKIESVDKESAEDFLTVAKESIEQGVPIDTSATFTALYEDASTARLNAEWTAREEAQEVRANKPEELLDDRSTNEVLEKEMELASEEQIKQESLILFDELQGKRRVQEKEDSLRAEQARGQLGTKYATVEPTARDDQEALTRTYDPEVPGEGPTEAQRISRGQAVPSDISSAVPYVPAGRTRPLVPKDAHERTISYWSQPRETREMQADAPEVPVENFSAAIERVSPVHKTALIQAAGEIESKKAELEQATTIDEIDEKHNEIDKLTKKVDKVVQKAVPAEELEQLAKVAEEQEAVSYTAADEIDVVPEEMEEDTKVLPEIYENEKGEQVETLESTEIGSIEVEYNKETGKQKGSRFIVTLKETGEEIVVRGRSAADEILRTGQRPEVVRTKGTKKVSKADRAKLIGKLTELEESVVDYLSSAFNPKGDVYKYIAIKNQVLLNRGKNVNVSDYTDKSIIADAKQLSRKVATSQSEMKAASEAGFGGSGAPLSSLEKEDGAPVEDSYISDTEYGARTDEGKEQDQGELTEEQQVQEEGAVTDTQELATTEEEQATTEGAPTRSTATVEKEHTQEKGKRKRFVSPAGADYHISEGLDQVYRIESELTDSGRKYKGKPIMVAKQALKDADGNTVGTFNTIEEAAGSIGASVGERDVQDFDLDQSISLEDVQAQLDEELAQESPLTERGEELKQVQNAWQGLQLIIREGTTLEKKLAKMLRRAIAQENLVGIPFGESDGTQVSRWTGSEVILGLGTLRGENYGSVLHEIVHSLTSNKLRESAELAREVQQLMEASLESLPPAVRNTVARMQELRQQFPDNTDFARAMRGLGDEVGSEHFELAYGHLNEREFLANTFNKESMQAHLKSVEGTGFLRNLYDSFIDMVRNALGLAPDADTLLNDVLAKTLDIARQETSREDLAVQDAKDNIKNLAIENVETVQMSKDKFLSLATSGQKKIDEIREEGFVERGDGSEYMEGEEASFIYDEVEAEKSPYPYLVIDKKGKTVGHEGRHRAIFGPEQMDVTLLYKGDKVDVESIKPQFDDLDIDTSDPVSRSAVETATDIKDSMMGTFKDVAKRYVTPISDRLNQIAPDLSLRLSKMDSTVARRVAKTFYDANEFEDQVKEKFSTLEFKRFSYLLQKASQNSIRQAKDMAKAAGVDMSEVWDSLAVLRQDMYDVELLSADKMDKEYFPRLVKDIEGLHDYYDKIGVLPEIKKKLQEKGIEPTEENIAAIMSDTLGKGGYPALLGKPGSSKARNIRKFEEEMSQFYHSPFDALRASSEDAINAVEQHKLVGKSRRLSLESKIARLEKSLETESDPREVLRMKEDLKDLHEKLVEPEEISKAGIGNFLRENGIVGPEQREVRDMLYARFNERGMSENMRMLKHTTLAMTLLNPTTAIKQVADIGIAISERGLKNTLSALKGIMSRDDSFDLYEMGIQQYIMEHGERQDRTSQLLDRGFSISGFKMMDSFGKQISYMSSLKEMQGLSREEFTKKHKDLKSIKDVDGLYDKLQKGDLSDTDVQDFMTYKVAQLQPLFLSQMSEKMLTAGNARVFGMLLQYALRRLGMISTHIAELKKEGGVMATVPYVAKLIVVLTAAEYSAECIAGIISGKPCKDMMEQLEKTAFNMVLLDRFTIDSMIKGNVAQGAMSLSGASAIESMDTIFKSGLTLFGDDDFDFKMMKNLPMGKIPYFWFTEEGQAERERAWDKSGEYKGIFSSE